MGARLKYAKVIDNDLFMRDGGRVRPGTPNRVLLTGTAPAPAMAFSVMRNWYDVDGPFTESWRIADRHGRTLHEGLEREVLEGNQHLVDEVDDLAFEFPDEAYQVVLEVDGREVARVDFAVDEPAEALATSG